MPNTDPFKDDLYEPMRKYKKGEHAGKYQSFVVFTPMGCESTFASKTRAMRDFQANKKAKVPSSVNEFTRSMGPDGLIIDCVDCFGAYRTEELD